MNSLSLLQDLELNSSKKGKNKPKYIATENWAQAIGFSIFFYLTQITLDIQAFSFLFKE